MANSKVHRFVFSPTGTTRVVVDAIACGTGRTAGSMMDSTHVPADPVEFGSSDLAVVGMPVYGGRLPRLAVERFAAIRGNDTPVTAVVVYGNRAYDDALLELCDLCTSQGFRVVGAAAFVGEHSFSSDNRPIAADRPNALDLQRAEYYGRLVAAKEDPLDLASIPGNRPYKEEPFFPGAAAESNAEHCIRCGQCVAACPSGALKLGKRVPETDPQRCIWCEACVRSCPVQSRSVVLPKILEIAVRLSETCKTRREPEWFPQFLNEGEIK